MPMKTGSKSSPSNPLSTYVIGLSSQHSTETIGNLLDRLRRGWLPFPGFPVIRVERELQLLLIKHGAHKLVSELPVE
jgi:hypothetical protein